jgi:UDP-glucose 4-epimerase
MTTILITGANGFVGKVLCATLTRKGYNVKGAIRRPSVPTDLDTCVDRTVSLLTMELPPSLAVVGDIQAQTDWRTALQGVDVVIHLAARVHVLQETAADALEAFRAVNTVGTENLARQAAEAGVKRFIFLSTIKVFGEHTLAEAITADTPVAPVDPYALSKWEAEQSLRKVFAKTRTQWVIIRPPLVYGAGVKGNFLRLIRLVKCGIPLPFARVCNKRSLIYVENLCELISVCIAHPDAAGQVLLCADTDDFSTPQLIRCLAQALKTPVRLWPLPVVILKKLAGLVNKRAEVDRLCDSLQVDSTQTMRSLNWQPPYTTAQGLAKSVAHFLTLPE